MKKETIGQCTLYLGDCREIAPSLSGLDAILADPPYGMSYNTDSRRFFRGSGRADRKIVGDDEPFDPTPWLKYPEVILWGANHYQQRLPLGSTLIWLKRQPRHYGTFLSDAEIGWQKGGHGVYALNAPDSNGRRQLEASGDPFGGTAHPTQKPIALMRWCLQRLSGRTVLDPFMGSGTTGVACLEDNRPFVGIEIDPEYFEIACERIRRVHAAPRLFA